MNELHFNTFNSILEPKCNIMFLQYSVENRIKQM